MLQYERAGVILLKLHHIMLVVAAIAHIARRIVAGTAIGRDGEDGNINQRIAAIVPRNGKAHRQNGEQNS